MPIKRSLLPWVIALAVFVAGFVAVGLVIRHSVASSFDVGQRARAARTLLFDTIKGQLDEETSVRGYLATRDPQFLAPYHVARGDLPATMLRLKARLGALQLHSAVAAVSDAERTNDEWLHSIAMPLLAPHADNTVAMQQRGIALIDRFRADTTLVEDELNRQNSNLRDDSEMNLLRLAMLIAFAALVLFVAGLTFAALQARAWNSLDRAREIREEARLRERGLRVAYEAEKRIADTLQVAFSQRMLPAMPSMRFSATYVAAAEEAKVGGDWYDAFEIGPERILFAIGDIAGHGLEAAVAMSRTRNEMLSAALLQPDAEAILAHINGRILDRPGAAMVTAIVGIADARTYEFIYSTAGHPPPLLVEPGRPPRRLSFGGLPLGVSEKATYRAHRVQTVPGAMLVLYTDGAIEHSRNIIEGEESLLNAVAAVPADADAATAIYQSIFHDKAVRDDVAILTIGFLKTRPLGLSISAQDGKSASGGRLERAPESSMPVTNVLTRITKRFAPGRGRAS